MSEPKTIAGHFEEIEDVDVVFWHIEDDRLGGFISTAYGLRSEQGMVLIDPLPLEPQALEALGRVAAIVLTSGSHQRSAWRLRGELEVPVWAPALAQELDEEPDERYGHSAIVPGDLVAFYTPGAGTTQHTLVLDDYVGFVPDLVVNPPGGPLALTPDEYVHDPKLARESVRLLLEQGLEILCPAHGLPIVDDVHGALQEALEAVGEVSGEPGEPPPQAEE